MRFEKVSSSDGNKTLGEIEDLEAEDIRQARIEINLLIEDGYLDHGPEWAKAWYQLDLKWSEGEPSYVTMPVDVIDELIMRAKKHNDVFDLVKMIAASRMRAGIFLPEGLNIFLADYLDGKTPPTSKGAGRKNETWGRDFIIARTFQLLENRWEHRRPTRRPDSKRHTMSISQILHEALRDTKIRQVDVDRIQKVRSEMQKSGSLRQILDMHISWMFDDDEDVRRV